MRLEAAITGNLPKFMKAQKAAADAAIAAGVREITAHIKADLQAQVLGAGLGNRLAKTWQSRIYSNRPKLLATAGLVYSKAPKLIRAFNDGVVIRGKQGKFLAIPSDTAPKRGVGGKRLTPDNFPEHSLGRLRFVYRPGKVSLLVVDDVRASTGKRGGFRKASASALKSGRGLATVVMFFLVPQVRLQKRLDYKIVMARWEPLLPDAIIKNWPAGESIP